MKRRKVLLDLNNQRVVAQSCPGDSWKWCISLEKVFFTSSAATVEKHGCWELCLWLGVTPLAPLSCQFFHGAQEQSCCNKSWGCCVFRANPPPFSHLLQSLFYSPYPLFTQPWVMALPCWHLQIATAGVFIASAIKEYVTNPCESPLNIWV